MLSYIKHIGGEVYAVGFDPASPASVSHALRTLARWASNPELSFTWWHAARASNVLLSAQAAMGQIETLQIDFLPGKPVAITFHNKRT